MEQPIEKEYFTYADYLKSDELERIEIINGKIIKMLTPPRIHQEIGGELLRQLANFLADNRHHLYYRICVCPFECEGDAPEKVDTVVEPDFIYVSDSNQLDDYGCKGAPDMVIEILSPSTMRHDRLVKFELYRRAGVREYWIVDPNNQSVEVYLRDENNDLRPHEVYTRNDTAKVTVLEGCTVELSKVFPETK